MKLSAYHATHGLSCEIRSNETGEAIHLVFPPKVFRAAFHVMMGDKRLEGEIRLRPLATDSPHDDQDLELVFRAPTGPVFGDHLDVKAGAVGVGGVRYDIDGAPMVATTDPEEHIHEHEPQQLADPVATPQERGVEAVTDAARKAYADSIVDANPLPAVREEPVAELPAGAPPPVSDPTAVPSYPGLAAVDAQLAEAEDDGTKPAPKRRRR